MIKVDLEKEGPRI